ncbi:SGNH/GDSL hydrolase family protein [Fodinicola acaciae]|uniref:SGNH/GDSL hydrolase family protein n=1 Tax=Fodinicola acaciae TaxID=2681555 RepID=UPI0013D29857|nr:SGNH/GDSL hydrolase family protein [Fodinicola acaciae]
MTVRRIAALCATLVASVLAAALVPLNGASAAVSYRHMVALGDSYAAGPLIPLPRLDPLLCVRSTSNYAAQLALRLGLLLYTDTTCSGAQTKDMTSAQPLTIGSHQPQFDALTADTDLVTISIGGNDYGVFGTVVGTCPGLAAGDPTGAPCKAHFTVDGVDTLRAAITRTQANITGVLQGIRQRSPRAKVLVVGYPRLVPASMRPCEALPLAAGDYPWADSLERALNDAAQTAASATGATFVDTYTPALGHDICAGDDAWVNGKDLNLLAAASYHPFFSGMAAEAVIAYGTLTGQPASAATVQAAFDSARAVERKSNANTAKLARILHLKDGSTLSPQARQALFPTSVPSLKFVA